MKPIEKYLSHIESIGGGTGKHFRISDENETPPIWVISFENVPEAGCVTAFTYGLSSVDKIEWRNSRPELVISVNSLDLSWPLAMGEIVRNGRNTCLFSYGSILRFGQQISDESQMDSFIVFACTLLNKADLTVDLPDRKVLFSQLYPIYQEEIDLIHKAGPEWFVFDSGIDFYDVTRKPFNQNNSREPK